MGSITQYGTISAYVSRRAVGCLVGWAWLVGFIGLRERAGTLGLGFYANLCLRIFLNPFWTTANDTLPDQLSVVSSWF
jgi:hypothetical protein